MKACILLVFSAVSGAIPSASVMASQPTSATFAKPDVRDVRTDLLQWLVRAGADDQARETIVANWADTSRLAQLDGEELLDLLISAFSEVDPATRRLAESSWGAGPLEDIVYDGVREIPIYRSHVDLYRARWLTQHRYFDEALEIYNELSPDAVVDPAGLFFYRAVCQSKLLRHHDALDSLTLLLDHTLDVPSRFRTVATILRKELGGRNDDGMDQVSQLMSDVHRRLDLGRSGERVQKREGEVIAAIDKLLEDMENQQKQQQQGGGGSGSPNQRQSGQPAERSYAEGIKGKGDADRKDIKETGNWGMLDRKEEAKARELIQQQFPAGYLDIISEYSRKLAEQE